MRSSAPERPASGTAARASLKVADVYRIAGDKGKEVSQLRAVLKQFPKSAESSEAHNRLESYGVALVGGLAYKAWQQHQQRQAAAGQAVPTAARQAFIPDPDNDREATALSLLLARSMIAAAKADGQIDNKELQKIVGRMQEIDADDATRNWVMDELKRPADLDQLVSEIPDESVAAQVYLASLFAIEIDTEAEINYLKQLAQRSGLDSGVVRQLHQMVGLG